MLRYLFVSLFTLISVLGPAWSDDGTHDPGRFQVIPGAQVPDRTGKPRSRTILLDTATGRTWTLAPSAVSDDPRRATWMPIPVQDFGKQEAMASPGQERPVIRRQESRSPEQKQGSGYRDRLWNYERDP
ncbi:MAG: hypothetical protein QNJ30_09685 [Kiloniellales bacterium]|nr:hypothetical protein [Kiloniellales bacterium]